MPTGAQTGGTLSKGLNRAFATLLAGSLAVGAHLVSDLCGEKAEPILLGVFVFIVGALVNIHMFSCLNFHITTYTIP